MTADGWRDCKLGDLLEIRHGYAFKGEFFGTTGTHVVVTPGNFFDEGGFKTKGKDEKWYCGPVPSEYVLDDGDIVVAMTEQAEGLLGSSAIVPQSGLYLHNQRIGLVRLRPEASCDPRFIYYLFNTRGVRARIRASATGAKIRHTAPSRIAEVAVLVPPLAEQRHISGILAAYDELIENNLRRVRILEEMARAIYREWFVSFRFPGHESVATVDSPLGQIPKGWDFRPLREVADVNRAQINGRSAPEELHYIDISSVSPGCIEATTTYVFSEAPSRARRKVTHGDVIWSCVRPNRRSHALVLRPRPNTIASTGFAVLTAKSVPFTYLYLGTTTDDFVGYLTNNATGAAYPAVTARTFEEAKLFVPSKPLLDQFAAITIPMAELVDVLQRQNVSLRAARDLLLPRLMSGRLSLAEAEASV